MKELRKETVFTFELISFGDIAVIAQRIGYQAPRSLEQWSRMKGRKEQ